MNKWITLVAWLVMAPPLAMAGEARHVPAPYMPSIAHNKPHRIPDKVAICMGCHGIVDYRIAFPHVYRVPALEGQNAQYIETALHQYKNGQRKMPTMQAVAASLTEQDITDIAAYYAQTNAASTL